MHMRVQAKVLPPGMQYAHRTAFDPKMSIPESAQCIPDRGKHLAVIFSAIKQTDIVKLMRQCKNDVVMLHPKGGLYQIVDPKSLFRRLAFWAVPVTTTIIAAPYLATTITGIVMSPQLGSTAYR